MVRPTHHLGRMGDADGAGRAIGDTEVIGGQAGNFAVSI
jgi:hypothetical protein